MAVIRLESTVVLPYSKLNSFRSWGAMLGANGLYRSHPVTGHIHGAHCANLALDIPVRCTHGNPWTALNIRFYFFFFSCIRGAAKLPLELFRRAYPSETITYLGHLPSLRRAIVRINNVHRFIVTMFSFLLFWTSRSALLKHQGN